MTPWYERAVFYHIYPLGLTGASKENDKTTQEERFDQLEEWIPHIKTLGCTAIYIGPLFESVGHGYETTDYYKIDRRLGTNEDFKRFVSLCHKEEMYVIVDGVFNHTGREFFAFLDIKKNRQTSRYKDWYCNVNFNGNNEYNDGFSYENWGGFNLLAKLNQRNDEVKNYIYDVIRFWVKEFDIDGIRLDAADVLDFEFMKGLRRVANEVKEDFWLMGEVIHGDYSHWVNNEMLHSVTNYELHKGIYSGHNDHNYFEIAHTIRRLFDNNGGICKGLKLYNFVDNHDVERIITKLNVKEHIYPVLLLLYTLPGIPSIYYGCEFGVEGKKERGSDANLRPHIDLSEYRTKEETYIKGSYTKILDTIIALGKIKKEREELSEGEYKELLLTNRQYAFGRIKGECMTVTAVNNDEKEATITVPIPVPVKHAVDLFTGKEVEVTDGKITLLLPASDGVLVGINEIE